MPKYIFDQWYDGEATNLNNFTTKIFEAFVIADGANRSKLMKAFPEWFDGLQSF